MESRKRWRWYDLGIIVSIKEVKTITYTEATMGYNGTPIKGGVVTERRVPICAFAGLVRIALGTAVGAASCRWSVETADSELSWDDSVITCLLRLWVDQVCIVVRSFSTDGAKCWDKDSRILTGRCLDDDSVLAGALMTCNKASATDVVPLDPSLSMLQWVYV